MTSRQGFSLIEVLIAVALIDAALLALVAASVGVLRQTAEMRIRSNAQQLAADRLQQLGASPCAAVSGDTSHPNGIREIWSVRTVDGRTAQLFDSVAYVIHGRVHSMTLQTRLPC